MNRGWSAKSGEVGTTGSGDASLARIVASVAATVLAISPVAFDASAAEPGEVGPRVTVTASRNESESPSEAKYADAINLIAARESSSGQS